MLKIILSFGALGDYNIIRKYTKKSKIFYPWYKMYEIWHCANLPLGTNLTAPIYFPHSPKGCFFSMFAIVGENCTIMQHVTIGSNNIIGGGKGPIIGDNVFIGAGAKIIGNVKIGNNVKIGAGSVVVEDIPDNCTVVMHKPRIIQK